MLLTGGQEHWHHNFDMSNIMTNPVGIMHLWPLTIHRVTMCCSDHIGSHGNDLFSLLQVTKSGFRDQSHETNQIFFISLDSFILGWYSCEHDCSRSVFIQWVCIKISSQSCWGRYAERNIHQVYKTYSTETRRDSCH